VSWNQAAEPERGMKFKGPPQRFTPAHFRERAREYRLAAALADARRDVAMFDDLAIMFERQAGILFEQKRPG
jgi:hypothetical protein